MGTVNLVPVRFHLRTTGLGIRLLCNVRQTVGQPLRGKGEYMFRRIHALAIALSLQLVAAMCAASAVAAHPAKEVHGLTSIQAAAVEANNSDKPIMVYLYASGVPECQKMDSEIFPDPKVEALAEEMVCVRLDSRKSEGAELAQRARAESFPAVVFLSPRGVVVATADNYGSPRDFARCIVDALMSYAKASAAPKGDAVTPDSGSPDAPVKSKANEVVWRVLLEIVPVTRVTVTLKGQSQSIDESLTPADIQSARRSFLSFPAMVASITQNRVRVQARIVQSTLPITKLTPIYTDWYHPTPEDVSAIIEPYDRSGDYDTIALFWKGGTVMGAWGLGGMFTPHGSTYLSVRDVAPSSWQSDAPGEVFLHEWIHGVAADFRYLGYAAQIPPRDADGGEYSGYAHSPANGWCSYYYPLLNGLVPVGDTLKGFLPEMWKRGAPRHRSSSTPESPHPSGEPTG